MKPSLASGAHNDMVGPVRGGSRQNIMNYGHVLKRGWGRGGGRTPRRELPLNFPEFLLPNQPGNPAPAEKVKLEKFASSSQRKPDQIVKKQFSIEILYAKYQLAKHYL